MTRNWLRPTRPGREMDAISYCIISGQNFSPSGFRFVDDDVQVYMGYPIGHVSPPELSTNDGLAMMVFNWMAQRGAVMLSNGDGDSYDCDWLPQYQFGEQEYMPAFVRAMEGVDCESWAHAICLALLVGVGVVELNYE